MTYIDLINRFWDAYRVKKFSDIDTAIYFFLLNECNVRRWLNPFELQTRNIEICIGVSRKTIGEARNRLKQRGVIDFVEAQGRGPATYLIDGADVTNEVLKDLFCVSHGKHEGNTSGYTKVTQTVTQGLHKGNTNAKSTLYNKERRYKTKDISPVGDTSDVPIEPTLFDEEEKNAGKRKSAPTKRHPEPPPPTLDDVKSYFTSQRADKRLQDWEREAEVFYSHFTSLGWRTSSGAKIERWESRANLWIMEHERLPKQTQNETDKTDKFSARRGTEPGAKSRKGFDGTF